MVNLSHAIWSLRPGSEFTYENDDYSTIKWQVLDGDAPTALQVKAALKKLEDEEKTLEADRVTAKAALLNRLGINAEEAALLLG